MAAKVQWSYSSYKREGQCSEAKNYGITRCAADATVDVTFDMGTQPGIGNRFSTYGYCAYHAPFAVKRHASQVSLPATMKARS
jgi:hypothetical protein